jgi:hypothetical protein
MRSWRSEFRANFHLAQHGYLPTSGLERRVSFGVVAGDEFRYPRR